MTGTATKAAAAASAGSGMRPGSPKMTAATSASAAPHIISPPGPMVGISGTNATQPSAAPRRSKK